MLGEHRSRPLGPPPLPFLNDLMAFFTSSLVAIMPAPMFSGEGGSGICVSGCAGGCFPSSFDSVSGVFSKILSFEETILTAPLMSLALILFETCALMFGSFLFVGTGAGSDTP